MIVLFSLRLKNGKLLFMTVIIINALMKLYKECDVSNGNYNMSTIFHTQQNVEPEWFAFSARTFTNIINIEKFIVKYRKSSYTFLRN